MTDTAAIQALHAGPHRLVLAITGGGSQAISDLLQVPGASNSVLEAVVPYSSPAFCDWLGREPESFCSRETALSMAAVAWHRAGELARRDGLADENCLGVACTASLASAEPKRGDHRCWIAIESSTGSCIQGLTLSKGERERGGEEAIVSELILSTIAAVTGVPTASVAGLLPGEEIVTENIVLPEQIRAVRDGTAKLVWSLPNGQLTAAAPPGQPPVGILSGAFEPLHIAHRKLRDVAEELLGGPVCYELPIRNADKPPLDAASIESRRRQFDEQPLALSAAPRFVDKAAIFPGTAFVLGFDTAERIVQPRFYGNSEAEMLAAFDTIRDAGCRFLVAGRESAGVFATIDRAVFPASIRDLFQAISEEQFRVNLSSTELRRSAVRV